MAEIACGCQVVGDACWAEGAQGIRAITNPHIEHCPRHSEAHIADLEAQVENHYKVHESDTQQIEEHCQRVTQLAARVRAVEEGLRKYGCHLWTEAGCRAPEKPCTCGLSTLLTTGGKV